MMEQGPVLIISFHSQQTSCLRNIATNNLIEGDPDKVLRVTNIWALCRDKAQIGSKDVWKLIDASSASSSDSWI